MCNIWESDDIDTKFLLHLDKVQFCVIAFSTFYLFELALNGVYYLLLVLRSTL